VFQRPGVPTAWCTSGLVYLGPGVPGAWCTSGLLYQWPGVLVAWCTSGLVYQRPGVPAAWCTSGLVYLGPGVPVARVHVLDHDKGVCVDPVKMGAILEGEGPGPPSGDSEYQLSPDREGGET
jgi:hypothetical protein